MLANHKSGGGQGRQEQGGGGGNRQANQPTYASGTPPRGQKWTPVPKSSGASRRTQQTSGSASGGGNKAPGHGNHESLPRPKASDGLVSQEEIDKRTAEKKCPRCGKGPHEYYKCRQHRSELIKRGGRFANLPAEWKPKNRRVGARAAVGVAMPSGWPSRTTPGPHQHPTRHPHHSIHHPHPPTPAQTSRPTTPCVS